MTSASMTTLFKLQVSFKNSFILSYTLMSKQNEREPLHLGPTPDATN